MPALLITVRFHDGRYHGQPEWPPSPARLFQALVAGAAQGNTLAQEDALALGWLESLKAAPVVAVPAKRNGQGFKNFVPNNDLDAVGGDVRRIGEIRAPKLIRPTLFDAERALLYAWRFDETPDARQNAQRICAIAERLYQFGRGVDMAWAQGELIDGAETEARLAAHGGVIWRPSKSGGGTTLPVPLRGSLQSLILRHQKTRERFRTLYESKPGKKSADKKVAGQVFVQPPKPRFRQIAYDSPHTLLLFDLAGEKTPWRLDSIVELTEKVREAAERKLKEKLPRERDTIHNVIVGRRDATEADKSERVRIAPLPSIGHPQVTRAIRRVLIEIPANCPLRADDIEWAFSGLPVISEHGEILCELVSAADRGMLRHYGIDDADAARLWRTVTPAALSQQAARRRIDPARRRAEAKGGNERLEEESRARAGVMQALRHAGVSAPVEAIRVQREPFEGRGARAEAFADGTRFGKERLWHVEIAFARSLRGPLLIGDGRYLGLGVMAPVRDAWRDAIVFPVPRAARIAARDRVALVEAVRRALMSLAAGEDGEMSRLFSGHEADGARSARGVHEHVFLVADDADGDGLVDRLIVAAPWLCDRAVTPKPHERRQFDDVVSQLAFVRAGGLGVVALGKPASLAADDPLVAPSRTWRSRVPYRATRHAGRGKDIAAALRRDIIAECLRRGWPRPAVEILEAKPVPNGGGLSAHAKLRFAPAVAGPLLLGRDSHHGGGVFVAAGE